MWFRLSKRMKIIAEEIKNSGADNLIDIGCDHGYIPVYLLKNEFIRSAVLIDISKRSLEKAMKLGENYNIKNARYICTDGLKDVQIADNSIVSITGMGGLEIKNIVEGYYPERLVLSPQKNVFEVREYLNKYYEIIRDYTIRDNGKYYFIISSKLKEKGKIYKEPGFDELLFGKTNLKNTTEDFTGYLKYVYDRVNGILPIIDSDDGRYENMVKCKEACEKILDR